MWRALLKLDLWRALTVASCLFPCLAFRILRASESCGIIADLAQKPVDGIQVGLSISSKSLPMSCTWNHQEVLIRIRRLLEHLFCKDRRHPAVGCAGDKQNWNIQLPDHRFDVTVIRIESDAERRE